MTREDEPAWVQPALVLSVVLLVLSVGWGFLLCSGGGGGDGGFIVLGEIIKLVLWCFCGVILAWLMAGAAAMNKSRAGRWLLALETPFLLYALYWLVILFSSLKGKRAGNYGYVYDGCGCRIKLAWILPHWSDVGRTEQAIRPSGSGRGGQGLARRSGVW